MANKFKKKKIKKTITNNLIKIYKQIMIMSSYIIILKMRKYLKPAGSKYHKRMIILEIKYSYKKTEK